MLQSEPCSQYSSQYSMVAKKPSPHLAEEAEAITPKQKSNKREVRAKAREEARAAREAEGADLFGPCRDCVTHT